MIADDDREVVNGQPTGVQKRRALGYLFVGLGAPILYAFGQFLMPSRHSGGWPYLELAARARIIIAIGAAVGLAFVIAGVAVLSTRRSNIP